MFASLLVIAAALLPRSASAQATTVGIITNTPEAYEGYTLFGPLFGTNVYLINNEGDLINRWSSEYFAGVAAYLLTNGNLLRGGRDTSNPYMDAGGYGGIIQEFDWEGNIVWEYVVSDENYRQHHDAIKLNNGNYLILAWDRKSEAEAIAAGRNPALISAGEIWSESLFEVQPTSSNTGNVVWEWHLWDHLIQDFDSTQANYGVVADHPELFDINYPGQSVDDWIHANGIDYHEEFQQIVISAHTLGEIWVIDHSTTTAEAAGHTGGNSGKGGDFIYRWGNPAAYRAGTASDRVLYGQHNPNWIPEGYPGAGNILVFNNGMGRPEGNFATVEEIVPPVDAFGIYTNTPGQPFGPEASTIVYQAIPSNAFLSPFISGAQRQPNGNTLICRGPAGRFFEVNTNQTIVWEYRSPAANLGVIIEQGYTNVFQALTFRATRYFTNYPAFEGLDLRDHGTIEIYTNVEFQVVASSIEPTNRFLRWASRPDKDYYVHHAQQAGETNSALIAVVSSIGTEAFFMDSDTNRLNAAESYYFIKTEIDP